MAFGAVATGSMKAQDAEIAAGTMSSSGATPAPTAAAASTGISSVAVAVFDVISVRKVTDTHRARISRNTGRFASPPSALPINSARPLTVKAEAMQMPPANSSSMPQGMDPAIFQSSSRPSSPSGTRNMTTTAASATVESPADSMPSHPDQPPKGSARVIHARIVSPNTTMTRNSGDRHAPALRSSIDFAPRR